jgi:hypothetical protein
MHWSGLSIDLCHDESPSGFMNVAALRVRSSKRETVSVAHQVQGLGPQRHEKALKILRNLTQNNFSEPLKRCSNTPTAHH